MTAHILTCDSCGQPFPAERSDARTCSSKCRQKAYRARVAVGPARRGSAYHEAGHAVVALALRAEVVGISLRRRPHADAITHTVFDVRGRIFIADADGRYRRRTPEELRADARERADRLIVVLCLAGYTAQRMLDRLLWVEWYDMGWSHFPTGPDGGHDDMAQADAIAQRLYPDGVGRTAFYNRSYGRAVRILRRRWPAVVRIAEALLERRKLTGAQVAALADLRRRHLP